MNEIILVDKPKGITSFGVIAKMRKKLNIRKIGHAGTLDPLATGLMILGVGKGTKKLTEFIKLDKIYEAEVLLGIKTTTGDLEGEIIAKSRELKINNLNDKKVKKILDTLVGEVELSVSVYSAIKKDGVPLYKRVRRGEKVESPIRKMKIYWLKFLGINNTILPLSTPREELRPIINIRIKVGSGTYIRSIAEEIGNRLGVPATVKELRRIQIGDFKINDAIQLDI